MATGPTRATLAVVPYARGDLLSRVYAVGADVRIDHRDSGTAVRAKVPADLAAAIRSASGAGDPHGDSAE